MTAFDIVRRALLVSNLICYPSYLIYYPLTAYIIHHLPSVETHLGTVTPLESNLILSLMYPVSKRIEAQGLTGVWVKPAHTRHNSRQGRDQSSFTQRVTDNGNGNGINQDTENDSKIAAIGIKLRR